MTPTPIMSWDSQALPAEPCVWWGRLDQRFQVEIHRAGDYTARLHIWDHDNGMAHIHSEEVGLAFQAIFGPDVADVELWMELATDFVDHRYEP